MPTTKDLIDDFVTSRRFADPGPDDRDTGDTFRTSEHQLFEVRHGNPHIVAGWQNPGTIDAEVWIGNEFTGWARRTLEDKLREARLVVMNVLPPDDMDDGADIIWWALSVECMSCGTDLLPDQRFEGLCPECADLRSGLDEAMDEIERYGIQQRRGLHGSRLPRSRPGSR